MQGNGSLDTTFVPADIDNSVLSLKVQADGKILIGGNFTTVNGSTRNRIARLNANGSLDTTFNAGSGPDGSVSAMALQPDGYVVIGGRTFTSVNGVAVGNLARLKLDGSVDTSFSVGQGLDRVFQDSTATYVNKIIVQSDGKILVGGDFNYYQGVSRNGILRLNADGSLDSTFNPGTGANKEVVDMSVYANGEILVGGNFTAFNGKTVNYMARIHSGDPDGDGMEDAADSFPNNAAETIDTDHDGIGNNADGDDDGDGVPDYVDASPLNPSISNEIKLPANGTYKGGQVREVQSRL